MTDAGANGAKVAVLVVTTALLAGAVLVGGLVLTALDVAAGPAVLEAGCYALLVVPLVRNAGVVLIDKRGSARALAVGLGVGLAALYAVAFLR